MPNKKIYNYPFFFEEEELKDMLTYLGLINFWEAWDSIHNSFLTWFWVYSCEWSWEKWKIGELSE